MPEIWPIGGGKGGTGKSFVTGSLGIPLAREGYQTKITIGVLEAIEEDRTERLPSEVCLKGFLRLYALSS